MPRKPINPNRIKFFKKEQQDLIKLWKKDKVPKPMLKKIIRYTRGERRKLIEKCLKHLDAREGSYDAIFMQKHSAEHEALYAIREYWFEQQKKKK